MAENEINNSNEDPREDNFQDNASCSCNEQDEIEKEWADALHFDKWPPDPAQSQTPPRIPEEAMDQQIHANNEPPHAPQPYIPETPQPYNEETPTAQGNVQSIAAQPEMPSTYLVWSVLATVLCCFIPGIIAIVYSTKVSSRYFARDYEGAKKASDMAQYWIIGSIVLGLILNTIYLPLMLVSGL